MWLLHSQCYTVTDVHQEDFVEPHSHPGFYGFVPVLLKTRIRFPPFREKNVLSKNPAKRPGATCCLINDNGQQMGLLQFFFWLIQVGPGDYRNSLTNGTKSPPWDLLLSKDEWPQHTADKAKGSTEMQLGRSADREALPIPTINTPRKLKQTNKQKT